MNLTDNEIIKALECCCGTAHDSCRDCPYDDIGCEDKLEKDALDLINRQKAEIERLQKQLKEGIDLSDSVVKIFKAEVIKGFANKAIERVEKARKKYQMLCKEQGEQMEEHMHIHFNGMIGIINDLVKEMVGE